MNGPHRIWVLGFFFCCFFLAYSEHMLPRGSAAVDLWFILKVLRTISIWLTRKKAAVGCLIINPIQNANDMSNMLTSSFKVRVPQQLPTLCCLGFWCHFILKKKQNPGCVSVVVTVLTTWYGTSLHYSHIYYESTVSLNNVPVSWTPNVLFFFKLLFYLFIFETVVEPRELWGESWLITGLQLSFTKFRIRIPFTLRRCCCFSIKEREQNQLFTLPAGSMRWFMCCGCNLILLTFIFLPILNPSVNM